MSDNLAYSKLRTRQYLHDPSAVYSIETVDHSIETVDNFVYLGSNANRRGDRSHKIVSKRASGGDILRKLWKPLETIEISLQ